MSADDGLIAFYRARLDEEERIALAASGEWDRQPTEPEHWRWECTDDDEPIDPELAIAANEEFLDHGGDHYRVGLRSLEEYPSRVEGMRPLVHLVISDEEVSPQVARFLAWNDPARVLREVEADRRILELFEAAAAHDDTSLGVATLRTVVKTRAAVFSDHPDYQAGWKP